MICALKKFYDLEIVFNKNIIIISRCQGCHNNYETPETIHFLITNGKCNYIRM